MVGFFFDMDGTIADLYSVDGWLESLRSSDPTPYAEAMPMGNMEALRSRIDAIRAQGDIVGVISWCSKCGSPDYNRATRAAKVAWLDAQGLTFDEINVVRYGRDKYTCRKTTNLDKYVLFDDEDTNIDNWNKHKDTMGVLVQGFEDILRVLDEHLNDSH